MIICLINTQHNPNPITLMYSIESHKYKLIPIQNLIISKHNSIIYSINSDPLIKSKSNINKESKKLKIRPLKLIKNSLILNFNFKKNYNIIKITSKILMIKLIPSPNNSIKPIKKYLPNKIKFKQKKLLKIFNILNKKILISKQKSNLTNIKYKKQKYLIKKIKDYKPKKISNSSNKYKIKSKDKLKPLSKESHFLMESHSIKPLKMIQNHLKKPPSQ